MEKDKVNEEKNEFEITKDVSSVIDEVVENPEEALSEGEKEVPKKKFTLWMIVGLCLIGIALVVLIFFIIFDKKEEDIFKPEKVIVDTKEVNLGADDGGVNISCSFNGKELNGFTVSEDMIIECSVNFQMNSKFNIISLEYDLFYGDGFKYLGYTENEEWKSKMVGEKFSSSVSKPSVKADKIVTYKFRVLEGANSNNLFINLKNIYLNDKDGTKYKDIDDMNPFVIKSNSYYIYKDMDGTSFVYDSLSDAKELTLAGEYKCSSLDSCTYIKIDGEFLLFDDNGFKLYNYKTDIRKDINYKFKSFSNIDFVIENNEVVGFIIDNMGYFSLLENSYIIPMHEDNYIIYNKKYKYILFTDGEETKLYDYKGLIYNPSISELTRAKESEFYYYTLCNMDYCEYRFYNKGGNRILENYDIYEYSINSDGNIVIHGDEGKFLIFNYLGEEVLSSRQYDTVYNLIDDYIVIVDLDKTLKIINYKEELVASFIVIDDKHIYHDYASGWMSHNNKEGIYLVIEDATLPVSEMGYKYFYIPSSNETGKLAIDLNN